MLFMSSEARLAFLASRKNQPLKSTFAAPAPQTQHVVLLQGSAALYTVLMPRSTSREQDILSRALPKRRPRLTSRRIGIHTSTARRHPQCGRTRPSPWLQHSSSVLFQPSSVGSLRTGRTAMRGMARLRAKYDLQPLVIHTNYLVNLASTNQHFLKKSIEAFRGEIERALAVCADYLVLHPASFRGSDREAGLLQTAAAIAASTQGLDLAKAGLTVLIENTAGAEFSLGGTFEQVAEVIDRLRGIVPIAACIDTCHTHVAGYDIVTEEASTRLSNSSMQPWA